MISGTITQWPEKGFFGFITPDDKDFSQVFIHRAEMPAGAFGPMVGLRLEFDIAAPDDLAGGKSGVARHVRIIGRTEIERPKPNAGTVRIWNELKGFGFVRPDDGKPDVFFGRAAFTKGAVIIDGSRVQFEYTTPTPTRGPAASRVWLAE